METETKLEPLKLNHDSGDNLFKLFGISEERGKYLKDTLTSEVMGLLASFLTKNNTRDKTSNLMESCLNKCETEKERYLMMWKLSDLNNHIGELLDNLSNKTAVAHSDLMELLHRRFSR